MSKFRVRNYEFNQELGKYKGKEGKDECTLCNNECECWSCFVGLASLKYML